MMYGQKQFSLLNLTGNTMPFLELYRYTDDVLELSGGTSIYLVRGFRGGMSDVYDKKQQFHTNQLSRFILNEDSVQIDAVRKDTLSPILLLRLLEEELKAGKKGCVVDTGADTVIELNECECIYQVNSLKLGTERKPRYSGNYKLKYNVRWTNRTADGKASTSCMSDSIVYEWEHATQRKVKMIPNFTDMMAVVCERMARNKAKELLQP